MKQNKKAFYEKCEHNLCICCVTREKCATMHVPDAQTWYIQQINSNTNVQTCVFWIGCVLKLVHTYFSCTEPMVICPPDHERNELQHKNRTVEAWSTRLWDQTLPWNRQAIVYQHRLSTAGLMLVWLLSAYARDQQRLTLGLCHRFHVMLIMFKIILLSVRVLKQQRQQRVKVIPNETRGEYMLSTRGTHKTVMNPSVIKWASVITFRVWTWARCLTFFSSFNEIPVHTCY